MKQKIKIYLDLNILIDALEDSEKLMWIKSNMDKLEFYYSFGHIEEIFKVMRNSKSKYRENCNSLLDLINEITEKKELFPNNGDAAIVVKHEDTYSCLRRVSGTDTVDIVDNQSTEKYDVDKQNYKNLQKSDRSSKNISNIQPNDIWEYKTIDETVKNFNENIKYEIHSNNESIYVKLNLMSGIDIRVSEDIVLKKNMIYEINKRISDLEYVVEILFRILTINGYNKDSKIHKYKSGTYDTTHSIYATACDYFVTNDYKFRKRCKAVYSFLGVDTKVVSLEEFEEIVLNDKNNSCK